MKLWILKPTLTGHDVEYTHPDGSVYTERVGIGSSGPLFGYDCNHGFVVRAANEAAARRVAAGGAADETADAWLNPEHSECVELSIEGQAEIILADFNAG